MPFFPIKPEEGTDDGEEKNECVMCYQIHFNEKLPNIVCENPTCESKFHTECLYQVYI